ncbi:hypothetical protein B0H14DRAFT_3891146 [Mycena olivaceomarginata]|nr:hypothetical protein B0H14DRAFT_3891146 [Mycena olivaceomarginata]
MKFFPPSSSFPSALRRCQPRTISRYHGNRRPGHDPNTSVVPLTLFALFQTLERPSRDCCLVGTSGPTADLECVPLLDELTDALNTATAQLSTNAPGDMGANDEDLANLINEILDGVNTALNKLVPKLGLNGLLTPVDAAVSGLLVSLDASLVPSLLAALQPLWLVSEALSAGCWLGSILPAFRFFFSAQTLIIPTCTNDNQVARKVITLCSNRIKFRYQYF